MRGRRRRWSTGAARSVRLRRPDLSAGSGSSWAFPAGSSGRLAVVNSVRRSKRSPGVQKTAAKLGHSDAKLLPETPFQAAIILRTAEDIADQVAKRRAVADELHHAGGDR